MLIVAGIVHVKPEAHDIAIKAMAEVMAETVKEPGCISYVFSPDIANRRLPLDPATVCRRPCGNQDL
ncbi:MAG: hypothetical protein V4671_29745 [Armatimonadota bacterium]